MKNLFRAALAALTLLLAVGAARAGDLEVAPAPKPAPVPLSELPAVLRGDAGKPDACKCPGCPCGPGCKCADCKCGPAKAGAVRDLACADATVQAENSPVSVRVKNDSGRVRVTVGRLENGVVNVWTVDVPEAGGGPVLQSGAPFRLDGSPVAATAVCPGGVCPNGACPNGVCQGGVCGGGSACATCPQGMPMGMPTGGPMMYGPPMGMPMGGPPMFGGGCSGGSCGGGFGGFRGGFGGGGCRSCGS